MGENRRWTVVLGRWKYWPENSILQYQTHINTLQKNLSNHVLMHNIVVLSGRSELA